MARRHHIAVGTGGWLLLLATVGFVVYWIWGKKGAQLTTTTQGTSFGPPAVWGTDPLTGEVTLNGQIYSPTDLQASNIVPSQHPNSPNSINTTNATRTAGSPVPITLVPNWSRYYPAA